MPLFTSVFETLLGKHSFWYIVKLLRRLYFYFFASKTLAKRSFFFHFCHLWEEKKVIWGKIWRIGWTYPLYSPHPPITPALCLDKSFQIRDSKKHTKFERMFKFLSLFFFFSIIAEWRPWFLLQVIKNTIWIGRVSCAKQFVENGPSYGSTILGNCAMIMHQLTLNCLFVRFYILKSAFQCFEE